jgi:hypothetical protein
MASRFNSLTIDSRVPSVLDSASTSTPVTSGVMTPHTRISFMSNANSATSFAPSITGSIKHSPDSIPDVPEIPDLPVISETRQVNGRTPHRFDEIPTSAPRLLVNPTPPLAPLPPPRQTPTTQPVSPATSLTNLINTRDDSLRDIFHFEPVPELPPPTLPVDLPLPSAPASEYGGSDRLRPNDEVATISDQASSFMPTSRQYTREADCSIGPTSSFRQMQGFCKGAESFRIGGPWEGIKQVNGFVANRQSNIGRCVGCGYGHNYEEVQLDMDKKRRSIPSSRFIPVSRFNEVVCLNVKLCIYD